jgi:type IV secretory pathway protease TraF
MLAFNLKARLAASALVVGGISAFVAPSFGIGVPLLIRNTGGSMPRGLYVWQHAPPAAKGEVIVVRDPAHFRWSWLMKRVVGTAGDRFCWRRDMGTHLLGTRRLPPPSPEALALGLRPWPGCRLLKSGEVVGYGASPDSYDSRYLGPIRETQLWGIYRPL